MTHFQKTKQKPYFNYKLLSISVLPETPSKAKQCRASTGSKVGTAIYN